MAISGESYKKIGRSAAGAVSIVTAFEHGTGAIVGLTVSSFVTLSFDPPLVMFAVQHNATSYPTLVECKSFGVSLLAAEQVEIARRFAQKGADKIAKTSFEPGAQLRVPLIADSLAQIECSTNEIIIAGDHAIVIGLVEAARTREGEPLLYYARRFGAFSAFADGRAA